MTESLADRLEFAIEEYNRTDELLDELRALEAEITELGEKLANCAVNIDCTDTAITILVGELTDCDDVNTELRKKIARLEK